MQTIKLALKGITSHIIHFLRSLSVVEVWQQLLSPTTLHLVLLTTNHFLLNYCLTFSFLSSKELLYQSANYLNPIIFFRPVEFAQGSADNVLIGMSWKWKMSRNSHAYGQLMFDEFLLFELRRRSGWWANKFGIQIGMRNFNFLTEGLHTQNEINFVRPFTYTHGSVLQAFGHVNQGLAHPMGTNFLEWVNIWRLERENWYVSQKFIWGIYGRDIGDDNFGGNVFRSYRNPSFQYGNEVAQGLKSTFHWEEVTYGRRFSKKQDLWGFASAALRFERNDHIQRVDFMLNVGVRTSLFPSYRDF